jgi:hypothetical protein
MAKYQLGMGDRAIKITSDIPFLFKHLALKLTMPLPAVILPVFFAVYS